MGDRRMISTKIANDGGFLKMPVSSQCLYFHLVVRADDDGIVEAFPVIRACGFNEDDLKILHVKEFVTVLNDNLVTFINHWREMNILRPDRKVDSRHLALLREKLPNEEILERRPRSDTRKGKREALAEKKKLDGPRTAQENLIQLNPNQQNLIEDKKRKDPSLLLPSDSRTYLDGKMGEGMDGKMDGTPDAAVIRGMISENIDLPYLLDIGRRNGESEEAMVKEIYDTICEMILVPRQSVKIRETEIPWETVRSQFMKLRFVHVSNVLNRIIDKELNIRNMHSYLITTLYTESLCGTIAEQADLHDAYLKEARGAPYYLGG